MKEISNCEVITVADERVVNKAIAFVVPAQGVMPDENLKKTILSHCQTNIPEYMVPAEVIYLDSIPLNPAKKPDLKELENIYNNNVITNVKKKTRK